jgi:BioD-like phosphotransacetylase family protein
MPAFVLLAPTPLSGKTTIAAALAQRLKAEGKTVALSRVGDDTNAAADMALFAAISSPLDTAQITIAEATAGDSGTGADHAIVVADGTDPPGDIAAFCAPLAGKLAGVVLNRVPARRADAIKAEALAAGLKVIGMLPEDRLLASPTLGEVAEALQAEKMFFDSSGQRPLDRALIASISADPGQDYFAGASTVIVRSDKPDLQLAALNAGVSAMIVTGDLPILSYVLDRAEEDTIPLLRTKLETADTVKVIEDLYASRPFAGGAEKLLRAAELAGEIDLAALLS